MTSEANPREIPLWSLLRTRSQKSTGADAPFAPLPAAPLVTHFQGGILLSSRWSDLASIN